METRDNTFESETVPVSCYQRVAACCDRFEAAWRSGGRPSIEQDLVGLDAVERSAFLRQLLDLELCLRIVAGERPTQAEYAQRFPHDGAAVASVFAKPADRRSRDDQETRGLDPTSPEFPGSGDFSLDTAPVQDATGDLCVDTRPEPTSALDDPAAGPIGGEGRYTLRRFLGAGGFARVFLGYDRELEREVAIKVPRPEVFASESQVEGLIREARLAAGLRHPAIVTVHDVGRWGRNRPYIVLEYINGPPLSELLRGSRPGREAAAELLASIADAVDHAHANGLVHRDLKPSNILIDSVGLPHVADFGAAVRGDAPGSRPGEIVGTPMYMAPEQVRGESHRLDRRTDVWALGVILYQMLAGRPPYSGTRAEVFEQILHLEPRPLRQADESIPRELDRICLKCLSKRMRDRYATAAELAADLRHWRAGQSVRIGQDAGVSPREGHPARVVPKGLRSFEGNDSDFFVDLLPGPNDREGLPACLRFWKSFAEEVDPGKVHSVGLIYGPSGCGKSSLIKAGLIPRIADHVLPVYVEATPDDTGARLLRCLRRHCPALPEGLGLAETFATLRGEGLVPGGAKVLVIVDQFEQWLHATQRGREDELSAAIRQCDGQHIQCIVAVRDDFWMALTRFLGEVEVDLVEGRNSAAVDLFEPAHARRILGEFGLAFGRIDERPTSDQGRFLERVVGGLRQQDGRISPVRLSLFVEMVKGRPWTPSTLKAMGGVEGIGVRFLEESFDPETSSPPHRLLREPARAVLEALLPEQGSDLRGRVRSRAELLEASGLGGREHDFAGLLRVLDAELRLVSPADAVDAGPAPGTPRQAGAAPRSYQLTHDYLVPAIRNWLIRERTKTRRGRAELRLKDRASRWIARRERRALQPLWEYAGALLFTRPSSWTVPERELMRASGRHHAARGVLLALVLLAASAAGVEANGRLRASHLHDRLLEASTEDVPGIVRQIGPYRRWIERALVADEARARLRSDGRKSLHANLALLQFDPGRAAIVCERLLEAEPRDFPIIREALIPHGDRIRPALWRRVMDPFERAGGRFKAACALAAIDPGDPRWEAIAADVAARLTTEDPLAAAHWSEALRPVRRKLLPPLRALFSNSERPDQRYVAASVLSNYLADDPNALLELVLEAEPRQLSSLLQVIQAHRQQVRPGLEGVVSEPPQATEEVAKDAAARRQANAALALLELGSGELARPLLRSGADPRLRTYLIQRFSTSGLDPRILVSRVGQERDSSILQALILGLAEYGAFELSPAEREDFGREMLSAYKDDPDPGIHSAVDRLFRRWGRGESLAAADKELAASSPRGPRRWLVDRHGQTLAIVRGPVEVLLREGHRTCRIVIPRSFALATREVTVGQYHEFLHADKAATAVAPEDDHPIDSVTWFDAVRFCRWLSEREGIPDDQMCYPPTDRIRPGMQLLPDHLERSGYRLPTEAEWVFASQAGAETARFYGNEDMLMNHFGWTVFNANGHTWPVGRLAPNALGLFDVIGNVYEWCEGTEALYPNALPGVPLEDTGGPLVVPAAEKRILRGGAFDSRISNLNSAFRNINIPTLRSRSVGFRVARTCK